MYQHRVHAAQIEALPLGIPGVSARTLWTDATTGAVTVITEMQPGSEIPRHWHTNADETVYVLDGDFVEAGTPHGPGTYFVGAKGTWHGPHRTVMGCRVLTHFSAPIDFKT